ncbi:ComE operon protein 1 [Rubinisphaera italica]|uniref:ComE operon protein 1 n=1 Tax=Rubinisphaera italica TaxID=2527969 RepID=A0A5C5X9G0_9PLAN|nr:ComE operon protein 1 [Rubinisphaera italica]
MPAGLESSTDSESELKNDLPSSSGNEQEVLVNSAVTTQSRSPLLTLSDQKIVALICLILTSWVLIRSLSLSHWRAEEIEIRRLQPGPIGYVIDINEANWLEFSLLDGIGEVIGKRIVAHREQQGRFESIQELQEVKGIGAKTFARIEPHLTMTQEEFKPAQ